LKTEEWPSVGEIVIVKIKEIMPYGAKAELVEYPGKEGFIHISQIASSWVKNIRSFISIGALRAAYVERVRPEDNVINLSLKKVSAQQQKRKMDDWKREKRADKMFEAICRDLKEDFNKAYKEIAIPLINEYGDLLAALENIKLEGDKAFEGLKIPKKWQDKLKEFADKNITISKVSLSADINLTFRTNNGLELIKKAFKIPEKQGLDVLYVGAPKYRIKIEANSYQEAEQELDSVLQEMEKFVTKNGGEFSYEKAKA